MSTPLPADPGQFMRELLAIWTETDPQVRGDAIAAHYHPDVVFMDPDGTFSGYEQLAAFSDSLQQRFPGQHFTLAGEPLSVGNALRARWEFGPVSGMDVALFRDGKVQTLYAFLEPRTA